MSPSEEEYEAWRDNPVTRWVMAACERAAEDNRQLWIDQSWEGGNADPNALIELRTRADAYRAIIECDYAAWAAEHTEEE